MFAARHMMLTTPQETILPVQITGSSGFSGSSVPLPNHNIGDLILIFAFRDGSATPPSAPAASGTVPAWVDIDNVTGANAAAVHTAYFQATATNHTSGTWTGATAMIAIVVTGHNASAPIGGHASATFTSTTTATAPAVTMVNTDGSSALLHFYAHRGITAWGDPPARYTFITIGGKALCNSKDDTTTDGSSVQSVTTSVATSGASAAVEICSPHTGNFFALF